MSLVEYVAHRWVMHRRFGPLRGAYESHAILHHGRYYRTFDREPDPVGRRFNIDSRYWWETLIGLSPITGLSWLIDPRLALCFVAASLVQNFGWTAAHREMHDPAPKAWRRWPVVGPAF